MIIFQVHSHPDEAFHSWIDDQEAIPRRVGAYSLVVPDFGSRPHLLEQAALFQLDANGRWNEISTAVLNVIGIAPVSPPHTTTTKTLHRRVLRWLTGTLKSFGRLRT